MLYLIKSFTRTKPILKIGYTDNLSNRMHEYFYANPGMEIISTREGDELLEDMIQMYLKFLGYQYQKDGRLNEWFINDPRVYQIFHISQDKLEKKLWKSREKIFNISKRPDLLAYEYLKDKNINRYKGIEFNVLGRGKVIPVKHNKLDVEYQGYMISTRKNFNVNLVDNNIIRDFLLNFYNTNIFAEKMKLFCEFMDEHGEDPYVKNTLLHKIPDPKFLNYYNFLGTAGCRAISYKENLILNKIRDSLNQDTVFLEVIKVFKVGDRLTKKDIKTSLAKIYARSNIKATAKAIDLRRWFEIKRIMITPEKGSKRVGGFEILALRKK